MRNDIALLDKLYYSTKKILILKPSTVVGGFFNCNLFKNML